MTQWQRKSKFSGTPITNTITLKESTKNGEQTLSKRIFGKIIKQLNPKVNNKRVTSLKHLN